jgi:hypothetical protein
MHVKTRQFRVHTQQNMLRCEVADRILDLILMERGRRSCHLGRRYFFSTTVG